MRVVSKLFGFAWMIVCVLAFPLGVVAGESDWQVQKSSGDVWISNEKVQKVALTGKAKLKSGDQIRTGKSGRVLLKRNKETILITPNSVIKLPNIRALYGKTHIVQQAGTITLDVEKRNVKHFEVETPFLAAVVKGTRFSVSVTKTGSSVKVLRGKVEVSDHKSGQYVLVTPGQTAKISPLGHKGIRLNGNGLKNKIKQGPKRQSKVQLVDAAVKAPAAQKSNAKLKVTKKLNKANGKLELSAKTHKRRANIGLKTKTKKVRGRASGRSKLRIGRAIGHVRLDISKATKGLSRPKFARGVKRSKSKKFATYWNGAWSNNQASVVVNVAGDDNNNNGGNNGNNGNGNGNNGNNGNGNGNNGNNGNGNGNNGNNGNGNGNNGNNGNGNGNN